MPLEAYSEVKGLAESLLSLSLFFFPLPSALPSFRQDSKDFDINCLCFEATFVSQTLFLL